MDNDKPISSHLQHALSQLHTALLGAPRVDDVSKRMLGEVLADIERVLGSGGTVVEGRSRLQALAVDFEAEHPSVATSLREFIELLGQTGI
jgi:hypothetical protein